MTSRQQPLQERTERVDGLHRPKHHIEMLDVRGEQDAESGHALPASTASARVEVHRIQRQRVKGWRMPYGVVFVGRPSAWGIPFPVTSTPDGLFLRADAVRMYRELVLTGETTYDGHHFTRSDRGPLHVPTVDQIREHLAGRDLACWCPPGVECHADFLLEIATTKETQG